MEVQASDVKVTLTHDEWDSLVDTAGYGINYWATGPCFVDEESETYSVRHEDYLVEGRARTTLTKADLERAIGRVLIGDAPVDGGGTVGSWCAQYVRDDDIDSDAADVIVQLAIFGKVVFG